MSHRALAAGLLAPALLPACPSGEAEEPAPAAADPTPAGAEPAPSPAGPDTSTAAGYLAAALAAAEAGGAFEALRDPVVVEDGRPGVRATSVAARGPGGGAALVVTVEPGEEEGPDRAETYVLGPEGRLRELAYFHQDVTDEGLRAEEGEGAVADGALRFRAEGGPGGAVEVEVPLGEDVLPRAVALYLLPRLAPYLPGDAVELRAFDVADPRAEPRRLRLARAESDGTEARFTLEGDPEVKGIVVRADRITLER